MLMEELPSGRRADEEIACTRMRRTCMASSVAAVIVQEDNHLDQPIFVEQTYDS